MRVLLVSGNRFRHPWPVMPVGLCCVASALAREGHAVHVLDTMFARRPGPAVERAIGAFRPQIVGLGVRNIDNGSGAATRFLLDELRRDVVEPLCRGFAGPVVAGGAAVSIAGADLLTHLGLEFGIRGDGERPMAEFCRRLAAGEGVDDVPGLVRVRGGRVVADNPPDRPQCLDDLEPPRPWRHIRLAPYLRAGAPVPVQSKRGCALSCAYCTYNTIEGRRYRLKSPERLAEELAEIVRASGCRHLEFADSTFNIPLDHAKAVLEAVIRRFASGPRLHLRAMGLSPAAVDAEFVRLMRRAGFRDVDLGVESLDDLVLQGLGKAHNAAEALRAGALLRREGIPCTWFLLAGGPGETEKTLRRSLKRALAAASPWDLVVLGVGILLYAGAPLAAGIPPSRLVAPVVYEPAGIATAQALEIAREFAARHANLYLYADAGESSPLLLAAGTAFLRLVAPRQPVWRLGIAVERARRLLPFA